MSSDTRDEGRFPRRIPAGVQVNSRIASDCKECGQKYPAGTRVEKMSTGAGDWAHIACAQKSRDDEVARLASLAASG